MFSGLYIFGGRLFSFFLKVILIEVFSFFKCFNYSAGVSPKKILQLIF